MSNETTITCPKCAKNLVVPLEFESGHVVCPSCQKVWQWPPQQVDANSISGACESARCEKCQSPLIYSKDTSSIQCPSCNSNQAPWQFNGTASMMNPVSKNLDSEIARFEYPPDWQPLQLSTPSRDSARYRIHISYVVVAVACALLGLVLTWLLNPGFLRTWFSR